MECSEPGTIREDELIAYLAGDVVRPVVIEHIARCARCSSQVEGYRRMDRKLVNTLYRWDCPSTMVLGEFHLGMLSNDQTMAIQQHLSMCVLCSAEVAALTEFLAQDPVLIGPLVQKSIPVRPVQTEKAVSNQHNAVKDIFRELHDWPEQARAGMRRIVATLLPAPPRLATQRGEIEKGAAGAGWPRNYVAEDMHISLVLEHGTGRRGILKLIGLVQQGSIAVETLEGIEVQLSTAQTAYNQQIDELGNFVFAPVVPAVYTLELQLPESVVVIEQLDVTAQP